jgi:hypothetical protein
MTECITMGSLSGAVAAIFAAWFKMLRAFGWRSAFQKRLDEETRGRK